MNRIFRWLELGILGFVALSAIPSGITMMVSPGGEPMEMPLSMLDGTPFSNFFWPGLLLFGVIGLGHALALFLGLKRRTLFEPVAAALGLGLIIWLYVQVSMIGGGHWLQILYFILGTTEVALAVLLLRK